MGTRAVLIGAVGSIPLAIVKYLCLMVGAGATVVGASNILLFGLIDDDRTVSLCAEPDVASQGVQATKYQTDDYRHHQSN